MRKIKLKIAHGGNEINVQELIPVINRMKIGQKKFLAAGLSIPKSPTTVQGKKNRALRITTWKFNDGYVIQRNS